jgi:two-component system, NarL family, response regulator DesR
MLRPRIVLADDMAQSLEVFAHILEVEFEIVGKAANGLEAVALSRVLKPDVLVLDISMSGLDGIAAARQLMLEKDHPRIVFLSTYSDPDYLDAAQQAGGLGFVLKPRARRDLATAVLLALEGRQFVSPGLSARR